MFEVVERAAELPRGSHGLSFHASTHEAAENAASFLAGTPDGQAAKYWVPEARLADFYTERVAAKAPDQVGCVAILPREQVEPVEGRLRPVGEVRQFLIDHPEGVTAAGDTLSHYWRPETVPEHLEYEAWFDAQPRDGSRFLCPYDLRTVPAERAPEVVRKLAAHHSHVVLSTSSELAVLLLQLFIFPTVDDIPESMDPALDRAFKDGLIQIRPPSRELALTPSGEEIVRAWGAEGRIGW